jgi:anti-sigma-K factor RskA
MKTISTESWNELLAGYVLGDLTPEEVLEVKQYLAAHPELENEVKALQATLSLLPLALPEALPRRDLGSELLQTAESISPNVSIAVSPRRQKVRLRWAIAFGSMAVTLLIGGLGLDSYRLRQELAFLQTELDRSQETEVIAQNPQNRLFSLKNTDTTQLASGSLAVVPSSRTVILTIQNLNPLPSGQVYRLWAFSQGKEMTCGDFNTNVKGQVLLQMPLEKMFMHTPSVFITVESSQHNVQAKGKKVMVGEQPI